MRLRFRYDTSYRDLFGTQYLGFYDSKNGYDVKEFKGTNACDDPENKFIDCTKLSGKLEINRKDLGRKKL